MNYRVHLEDYTYRDEPKYFWVVFANDNLIMQGNDPSLDVALNGISSTIRDIKAGKWEYELV